MEHAANYRGETHPYLHGAEIITVNILVDIFQVFSINKYVYENEVILYSLFHALLSKAASIFHVSYCSWRAICAA